MANEYLDGVLQGANAVTGNIWELIEERVISSASTTETFSSLNGNSDGSYMLQFALINDQGSSSNYNLQLNGSNWACDSERLTASGATVSSANGTEILICSAQTMEGSAGLLTIPALRTGDLRMANCYWHERTGANTQTKWYGYNITTPANSVNITSLGVTSTTASAIGIGSVLRLWKVRT